MTFDRFGEVALSVQDSMDGQVKQLSRWMKPYGKRIGELSGDLRPYAKEALELARKNPGKTVFGAVLFGYLLARLGRR